MFEEKIQIKGNLAKKIEMKFNQEERWSISEKSDKERMRKKYEQEITTEK